MWTHLSYNALSHELQVWDVTTGQKQYTFEGHDAPVYSVCPHYKESIQVPLFLLVLSFALEFMF